MATTRNVLIDLVKAVGGGNWSGASVEFKLATNIAINSQEVYPSYEATYTTATDGTETAVLVVPDTGAFTYVCTLPTVSPQVTQKFIFALEAGSDIYLSTLVADANLDATENPGDIQAAIDAHEALPDPHTVYLLNSGDTSTGLIQFSGTTHAGLKLNELTTVQRDALTPASAMFLFDTNLSKPVYYNGSSWFAAGSDPGTLTVATTNTDDGTTHTHAITTTSNPGAAAAILATDANGSVVLDTNLLYVDAVNNVVGIGTATPEGGGLHIDTSAGAVVQTPTTDADDLVITHNGSGGASFVASSSSTTFIAFADTTATRVGSIAYNHSIDVMRFRAGGNSGDTLLLSTADRVVALNEVGSASAIESLLTLRKQTSGTPTTGMGAGVRFQLKSTTTNDRDVARISGVWSTAVDLFRTGDIVFETVNGGSALAERLRLYSAGNVVSTMVVTPSAGNVNFGVSVSTGVFFPASNEIGFSVSGTEVLKIESDGDLLLSAANATIYNTSGLVIQAASQDLAFYGGTPAAKPTVTGSRAGNAALASLLTALSGLGLLTDSSSA